ncbi:MAG TPA: FAD:protein FMN transferase [Kouleothrix sp.]|uniref:FAD:protein FMN transferase n=1 Tax=Kouleothrix sp. TaxID=2779161 RepID=UPI002C870A78|nr:FAD:protein FMN transferase [Kouleothrix sp.]HRC76676.1 FAD:protein FMN transferase [Kouleothrix sp.]
MKQTRLIMGMPVSVEVADAAVPNGIFEQVFAFFTSVDAVFSTYKPESEISRINRGALTLAEASHDMRTIFALAEQTRQETGGYFDIARGGAYDPSGIVKGWAIYQAAQIMRLAGCRNFYVDAGGDIQATGCNRHGQPWRVGIRSPFAINQIVKVLAVSDRGVATSGTSIRGEHIYNPMVAGPLATDAVSLTVIGPNIYEADRFATAAFAMGAAGILFIERLEGFEGYLIDRHGQATFTSGLGRYIDNDRLD